MVNSLRRLQAHFHQGVSAKNHLDLNLERILYSLPAKEKRVFKRPLGEIFSAIQGQIEHCRASFPFDERCIQHIKNLRGDLIKLMKRYDRRISGFTWKVAKAFFCLLTVLKICCTNPFLQHEKASHAALKDFYQYINGIVENKMPAVAMQVETDLLLQAGCNLYVLNGAVRRAVFFNHLAAFLNAFDTWKKLPTSSLKQLRYDINGITKLRDNKNVHKVLLLLQDGERLRTLKNMLRANTSQEEIRALLTMPMLVSKGVLFTASQATLCKEDLKKMEKLVERHSLIALQGLTHIRLRDLSLKPEEKEPYFSLMKRIEHQQPIALDCSGFHFDSEKQLEDILYSFPIVTSIDLRGCGLSCAKITGLLEKMPYLEHLSIDQVTKEEKLMITNEFSKASINPKDLRILEKCYSIQNNLSDPGAVKWRYLPDQKNFQIQVLQKIKADWPLPSFDVVVPILFDIIAKRPKDLDISLGVAKDLVFLLHALEWPISKDLEMLLETFFNDFLLENSEKIKFELQSISTNGLEEVYNTIDQTEISFDGRFARQEVFLNCLQLRKVPGISSFSYPLLFDSLMEKIIAEKKEYEYLLSLQELA